MKRFVIVCAGAWLLACTNAEQGAAPPASKSAAPPVAQRDQNEFRQCRADSDCVIVPDGCCSCLAGGRDTAVNKDHARDFRARFDCTGGICNMAAMLACNDATAHCEQGVCVYRAP